MADDGAVPVEDATFHKHSIILFTNEAGGPLRFHMRPSEKRKKVASIIKHGGGIISSKINADSLRLAKPGEKLDMEYERYDYIYVIDCAERNQLLDIEPYRIPIGETMTVHETGGVDGDILDDDISTLMMQKAKRTSG